MKNDNNRECYCNNKDYDLIKKSGYPLVQLEKLNIILHIESKT